MVYGQTIADSLQATASGHHALHEAMSLERYDRMRILMPGGPMVVALILMLCLMGSAVAVNEDLLPERNPLRETGLPLVIHSRELARQVTAIAEDAMRPERSYQPRLVAENTDNGMAKRLQWRDIHQGAERISDVEPEATPIQRGLLRVLQALPIEGQL